MQTVKPTFLTNESILLMGHLHADFQISSRLGYCVTLALRLMYFRLRCQILHLHIIRKELILRISGVES